MRFILKGIIMVSKMKREPANNLNGLFWKSKYGESSVRFFFIFVDTISSSMLAETQKLIGNL